MKTIYRGLVTTFAFVFLVSQAHAQIVQMASSPTYFNLSDDTDVVYQEEQVLPAHDHEIEVLGNCAACDGAWGGYCSECASSQSVTAAGGLFSVPPDGCSDGGCVADCACGTTCLGSCGAWAHYTNIHGSVLYLRPRNADVAYAVPIDGPITQAPANNPIQIGKVGIVDPDYDVGFSAGADLAINVMSSLFVDYSALDSTTRNQISTAAPNVIRSIVSHPSSSSVATDFLSAAAELDIEYDTLDAGLRHLFVGGEVFAVNYFVGARYARLEQRFRAEFVDNGTEEVLTDIDFDGVGPRLGFDAQRHSCHSPLNIYTRAAASFLAGRFQANYFQGQTFDPTVVNTSWEAGRIVPILDIELGAGWTSRNGHLHLSFGYAVSAWFNAVKTEDFIRSVQHNDFIELHDTITFDGLVGRAELRF